MKTKSLKHYLLLFSILLSLIVSFNGCSDDDEPTSQTFLEKYDGTKWINMDEHTRYIKFNNKTENLVEQWILFGDCYYYNSDYESENLNIIENSIDNLIVKYTDLNFQVTKIITFTIQKETLKIVLQENDDKDIMYFDKTSVNVDDFEVCDPNFRKTYVPDDNFEQALIDLGYDDILDDYVLLTDNIKYMVELNVSNLEIKDLTGIEDFKSLTSLKCWSNQLTSLDVSSNTSLNDLGCSFNQLTSLDVSNNSSLRILYCSSNQLTSLDVSKNTKLQYLYCYNNQLSSLDVSNNKLLRDFYCYENQLTSLDISNNTVLYSLKCYQNQLTSLDVSMNTILEKLECNSNQITCIKVSESQLNNDVSNWTKDDSSTWSLDCD